MGEHFAGRLSDFDSEDARILIDIGDSRVAVFRCGERLYAYQDRCLHMGGPVGEGVVVPRVKTILDDRKRVVRDDFSDSEFQLVCPWHGWAYDVETGEFAGDPSMCLKSYPVRIADGDVHIIA